MEVTGHKKPETRDVFDVEGDLPSVTTNYLDKVFGNRRSMLNVMLAGAFVASPVPAFAKYGQYSKQEVFADNRWQSKPGKDFSAAEWKEYDKEYEKGQAKLVAKYSA